LIRLGGRQNGAWVIAEGNIRHSETGIFAFITNLKPTAEQQTPDMFEKPDGRLTDAATI